MANKSINDLVNASGLDATDLLVLWDSGTNTAQNMTGQQFATWLTALAAGHGGISSIAKTGTAGLVDTYTITYADTSTSTFTVTNGAQGPQGDQTYVWIKYAGQQPTSDADMGDIPDAWIGVYIGTAIDDPADLHYTDLTWYSWQGPKGEGVAYTAQTGTVGLTRTYTMYTADGTPVGSFSVTDGEGAVSTVNGIAPDGDGDVPTIVASVTALGLTSGSATVADAYDALLPKQILICPASDFAVGELPLYNGNRLNDGSIEIVKGDGTDGWIEFHGRQATVGDFRMFFTSSDIPAGTWIRSDLVSESGTPTATSGTISSSAYVKRSGNTVVLDYAATGVDIPTTNTKIGSVPAKFAPSETTFGIGLIGFGAATPTCYAEVTTGGDIRIRGNTAQSSVSFRTHLTWIQ